MYYSSCSPAGTEKRVQVKTLSLLRRCTMSTLLEKQQLRYCSWVFTVCSGKVFRERLRTLQRHQEPKIYPNVYTECRKRICTVCLHTESTSNISLNTVNVDNWPAMPQPRPPQHVEQIRLYRLFHELFLLSFYRHDQTWWLFNLSKDLCLTNLRVSFCMVFSFWSLPGGPSNPCLLFICNREALSLHTNLGSILVLLCSLKGFLLHRETFFK